MKTIQAYLICALISITIFWLHVLPNAKSMLKGKNELLNSKYISSVIRHHSIEKPSFIKRPFSSLLFEKAQTIFNIELSTSFVIISFSLLFFSGLLVYHLSMSIVKNTKQGIINMIIFLSCFSNVFIFFPPIYTYDEPLQYVLILVSLIFCIKQKWIAFIIAFSLSLITRESGLILIPGLFILILLKNQVINLKSIITSSLIVVTPIIIYFICLGFILNNYKITNAIQTDFTNRFSHFYLNFQSKVYAIESFTAFVLVIGLPTYFVIALWIFKSKIKPEHKKWLVAFLITLVLNTAIVFLTTKAREARLFILPIFFLWPIFSDLFSTDLALLKSWQDYKSTFTNWHYGLLFLTLLSINHIYSNIYYTLSIGYTSSNLFNEYLMLTLLIASIHLCLSLNKSKSTQHKSNQIV